MDNKERQNLPYNFYIIFLLYLLEKQMLKVEKFGSYLQRATGFNYRTVINPNRTTRDNK